MTRPHDLLEATPIPRRLVDPDDCPFCAGVRQVDPWLEELARTL